MFIILRCSSIRVIVAQAAGCTELDRTYVGVINSLHLLHCTSNKPQANMQIEHGTVICSTCYCWLCAAVKYSLQTVGKKLSYQLINNKQSSVVYELDHHSVNKTLETGWKLQKKETILREWWIEILNYLSDGSCSHPFFNNFIHTTK